MTERQRQEPKDSPQRTQRKAKPGLSPCEGCAAGTDQGIYHRGHGDRIEDTENAETRSPGAWPGRMSQRLGVGEAAETRAGETREYPAFVQAGAETAVETDRGSVPIENNPFHLVGAILNCDSRESRHQRFPCTSAALVRKHKDVLDEKDRAASETRIC